METVTILSNKLLSLVRSVDVPVLPSHIDPAAVFTLGIGLALLVGAWTAVLMFAAALRPKSVPSEHPRVDKARAGGERHRRAA